MKTDLLVLRGGNLYAEGANGLVMNNHLVMESFTLPALKEKMEDFAPAANNGAIEVAMNREAVSAKFSLKGLQPEVLTLFSTPFGARRKFTYFGALVNEYGAADADRQVQVIATMYGRLSAELGDGKGGEFTGVEYEIKSVSKYTLVMGVKEVARFNIELGGWVDAEGQSAQIANMIGISAAL